MRRFSGDEVLPENAIKVSTWGGKQIQIHVCQYAVDKIGETSRLQIDVSEDGINIQISRDQTGQSVNHFTEEPNSGAGFREVRKSLDGIPLPVMGKTPCKAVLKTVGGSPVLYIEVLLDKAPPVGHREDCDEHNRQHMEKILREIAEMRRLNLGLTLVAKTSTGEEVEVTQLGWKLTPPPLYLW